MYPGSLPFIFNGSVPGHEKLFNVRRCTMYTGVQFGRFHCTLIVGPAGIVRFNLYHTELYGGCAMALKVTRSRRKLAKLHRVFRKRGQDREGQAGSQNDVKN